MPFHDGPITGSTTPNGKKRVALVIGNSAYVHAAPLANPKNDADRIAEVLQRLDFKVLKGVDLGLNEFLNAKNDFEALCAGVDVALLFFAGHGIQVRGLNYLVPVDAEIENLDHLKYKTIELNDLMESITDRAKASLIFLDACRNNPFTRNLTRSMGARSGEVRSGLAKVEAVSGTFISFATAPDTVAMDGTGQNSPYTSALIKHIETPGLGLSDMMIDVRNDVLAATSNKQEPWDQSSLRSRFFFVPKLPEPPMPERAAPIQLSEAAEAWSATQNSTSLRVLTVFKEKYAGTIYADFAEAHMEDLRKLDEEKRRVKVDKAEQKEQTRKEAEEKQEALRREKEKKKQRAEAEKRRHDEAWEEIKESDDPEKLHLFVKEWPDSAHIRAVHIRLRKLGIYESNRTPVFTWLWLGTVLLGTFAMGFIFSSLGLVWLDFGHHLKPGWRTGWSIGVILTMISGLILAVKKRANPKGSELAIYWLGCAVVGGFGMGLLFDLFNWNLFGRGSVTDGMLVGGVLSVITGLSLTAMRYQIAQRSELVVYSIGCGLEIILTYIVVFTSF